MNIILFIVLILTLCMLWTALNGRLARSFWGIVMLIWLIPLGISLSNPFELFDVSLEVYSIVALGIISFGFGYLILNKPIKRLKKIDILDEIKWIYSIKLVRITYLLSLGLLCSLTVTQWSLISTQGGMGNLKLDFFELVFNNNSGLFFLYQSLIVPLYYISCMIFAYMTLSGCFSKKIIPLFIYIFLFSYVGGKRGYFSIFLQYYIIAYITKRFTNSTKKNIVKIKTWLKIFSIGCFAFLGAVYVTTIGNSGAQFDKSDFSEAALQNVENVIVYQIGPYRALDYALKHNYIEKFGGYTLGRSTIGGMIDYYGCGILNMFGVPIQRARDLSMGPLQDNSIMVGNNRSWNFSFTSFYYFMFDFGWMGVLFFSFLFGVLVRFVVNLYDKSGSVGSLCLLGYMFISCVLFNASWFNISLYSQPLIIICIMFSCYELKMHKRRVQYL